MALHKVATVPNTASSDSAKLFIATMPCSCEPCRTGTTGCKFVQLRGERVVEVTKEGPVSARVPNPMVRVYNQQFEALENELRTQVLDSFVGKITTVILKDALKKRKLPLSGRKFELASRLLSYEAAVAENRQLLAIDALDLSQEGGTDIAGLAAADDEGAEDVDADSDDDEEE